ncbi:MAG: hypothetical protein HGA19_22110, partial [Oscillochloris sp.]|nr:hypothetical protein [Oscillochloris sp.]
MRFFLRRSFTFLLVAVAGLLLATSPAAHAQTLPSEIVGTTNTFATQPRTDGTYVVWLHLRSGYDWQSETAYYDLYVSNLQSRQPQRIAGDPGSASDPDVDGGVVVWAQSGSDSPIHNRDILAKNLATGEQWTIAATTADETRPAISGNLVVWVSNDGSTTHLIGRYIGTTTQPFVVADLTSTQAMADGDRPALDGTRVVWVDIGDDDEVDGHSYFMRTVVIGSGQSPVTLATIPGSAPTGFDLWGNTVVASIGRQITIFDLATGQQRTLPSFGGYPTTDGQYILWQKMYAGGDYRPPTLVGYDLAEDHEMILDDTLNAFGQTPLLQKGIVTYIGKTPESVQGSDNVCIYALTIHQLLTGTQ